MTPPKVTYYFSTGSRYSFLSMSQIPQIEYRTGIEFEWVPVNGKRIRSLRGADPFKGEPQSGQYDWTYRENDAKAWARYYGITFAEPVNVEFDVECLLRGVISASKQVDLRRYAWDLAKEVFAYQTWPLDDAVVMGVAQACNLDMPKFEQDFFDPQTQSTLEDNCARAVKHGAFGTPSLFIDEQLYWGNDRLRLLEHDLLTQHGTDAWQVMGLDHVVLNSPAPEQLANFYIAALGGRLERQFKDFLWQIRFGDCLLDIFRSESMSEEAPLGGVRNMNHFCLRLANFNIDGIAKHLNSMGVELTLPGEIYGAQGFGPSIYFVDPEGNQVELKGLNLGEQKLYIE